MFCKKNLLMWILLSIAFIWLYSTGIMTLSASEINSKSDVKNILEQRFSEFNHYLIAKDYEKAKEYIEPRERGKWFKKMKERDILTDILAGNPLPRVEKIDYYESDRVAVVTTTIKLPASAGGSDYTGGENWIFLNNQWYKSDLDILPLRAIAKPVTNEISPEVSRQIQTLEQLIYQNQDEAVKYFEESQKFGELMKQSQKKFMALTKESQPDISLLKEEMAKQEFYLQESKKNMQLMIEVLGKQKEYANQLLELKR